MRRRRIPSKQTESNSSSRKAEKCLQIKIHTRLKDTHTHIQNQRERVRERGAQLQCQLCISLSVATWRAVPKNTLQGIKVSDRYTAAQLVLLRVSAVVGRERERAFALFGSLAAHWLSRRSAASGKRRCHFTIKSTLIASRRSVASSTRYTPHAKIKEEKEKILK